MNMVSKGINIQGLLVRRKSRKKKGLKREVKEEQESGKMDRIYRQVTQKICKTKQRDLAKEVEKHRPDLFLVVSQWQILYRVW